MLTEHLLFWYKGWRDLEINSVCPKVAHSGRGTNVIAQNKMLCRNFPQEAIVTEQMPNKSLSRDTVTLTDEVTACEEESASASLPATVTPLPSYLQSFLLPTHLTRVYRHLLWARLRVLKTNPTKTQLSVSRYSAHYKFWALLPGSPGSKT